MVKVSSCPPWYCLYFSGFDLLVKGQNHRAESRDCRPISLSGPVWLLSLEQESLTNQLLHFRSETLRPQHPIVLAQPPRGHHVPGHARCCRTQTPLLLHYKLYRESGCILFWHYQVLVHIRHSMLLHEVPNPTANC